MLPLLSEKLTSEYGKRFTVTNLRYKRQFYLSFQNRHTLCDELSWSHYRLIMKVENESDTLVKYTLPEGQNQIYASKYMLYIPSEEELRKEILLEREYLENK